MFSHTALFPEKEQSFGILPVVDGSSGFFFLNLKIPFISATGDKVICLTKIILTQDTEQHPSFPVCRLEVLLPASKSVGITAFQLSLGFGQIPGGVYIAPIQSPLSCVLPLYLSSLDSAPALLVVMV